MFLIINDYQSILRSFSAIRPCWLAAIWGISNTPSIEQVFIFSRVKCVVEFTLLTPGIQYIWYFSCLQWGLHVAEHEYANWHRFNTFMLIGVIHCEQNLYSSLCVVSFCSTDCIRSLLSQLVSVSVDVTGISSVFWQSSAVEVFLFNVAWRDSWRMYNIVSALVVQLLSQYRALSQSVLSACRVLSCRSCRLQFTVGLLIIIVSVTCIRLLFSVAATRHRCILGMSWTVIWDIIHWSELIRTFSKWLVGGNDCLMSGRVRSASRGFLGISCKMLRRRGARRVL
jgi:hypothetical protein